MKYLGEVFLSTVFGGAWLLGVGGLLYAMQTIPDALQIPIALAIPLYVGFHLVKNHFAPSVESEPELSPEPSRVSPVTREPSPRQRHFSTARRVRPS